MHLVTVFDAILTSQVNAWEITVFCKSVFWSEQSFYGNYSTLDSHTNTVISHTFAYTRQDGVENRDKTDKVY